MAISNIKTILQSDVQTVWNVVTSLKEYGWRSDLSQIEVLNESEFIEYTKDGISTKFTITVFEPCKRWEFEVENSHIKGRWIGLFTDQNGYTEIDFTEIVTAKKLIMKPFVKVFLKKQQEQYISDLRKIV